MALSTGLQLKFWGVRGSIPTPRAENLGYGGNTACVELRFDDRPPLILDCGTGIRDLGMAVTAETFRRGYIANILLTHFHWDHVQGLPFFPPLYRAESRVNFYSTVEAEYLGKILEAQFEPPFFPIGFPAAAATRTFHRIGAAGRAIHDLMIHPFPLRHPNGASGYRIDTPAGSVVYCTDHECGDPEIDDRITEIARDADVLIYDSQFTPADYAAHRGWGHSTWLDATRVARQAAVKQLVLFHHDPRRTDAMIDEIVLQAAAEFPNTSAAREGAAIRITPRARFNSAQSSG